MANYRVITALCPKTRMYGLIIAISVTVCVWRAQKLVKEHKLDENSFWGACFWSIVCAILGARIYHVIDKWDSYYSLDPDKILFIWQGGLAIYGAIAGGLIGLIAYLESQYEDLLPWLDVAGLVLPLGQAIGRWGNYFNFELFGMPTDLPWGFFVPVKYRPEVMLLQTHYHPLFLYESVLSLALFLFLNKYKNKLAAKKGKIFFLYLAGYALIRFFLETLRLDSWTVAGLNVAQTISILVMFVCAFGLAKVDEKIPNSK